MALFDRKSKGARAASGAVHVPPTASRHDGNTAGRDGRRLVHAAADLRRLEPRKRSAAAAQFNYAELCFALDLHYGLKESHDIRDFDTVFDDVGFRELLLDPDPVVGAEHGTV